MIHVLLPDGHDHPLPFYLAMEEYLARLSSDDYFFMWQVDPTVIIGRNQHILTEVNLDYCRSRNIAVVRRKSGGGCVYADRQNIMFSYITTSPEVVGTFTAYTGIVASFLRSIGLEAEAGGRNDITIGGRKVSGNAFYHTRGRAIVHGTMLFDTDVEEMLRAITPSDVKLTSKGIASVRSRVTNVSEHLDITLDEFKRRAAQFMCSSSMTLSPADVVAIESIARPYFSSGWLYGSSPRASVSRSLHIDGVGELILSLDLSADSIRSVSLSGDYFPLVSDVDSVLSALLRGVDYTPGAIRGALASFDASTIIRGLETSSLIDLMLP